VGPDFLKYLVDTDWREISGQNDFCLAIHYKRNGCQYVGILTSIEAYVSDKRYRRDAGLWFRYRWYNHIGGSLLLLQENVFAMLVEIPSGRWRTLVARKYSSLEVLDVNDQLSVILPQLIYCLHRQWKATGNDGNHGPRTWWTGLRDRWAVANFVVILNCRQAHFVKRQILHW